MRFLKQCLIFKSLGWASVFVINASQRLDGG